jgi:hypothetical protein
MVRVLGATWGLCNMYRYFFLPVCLLIWCTCCLDQGSGSGLKTSLKFCTLPGSPTGTKPTRCLKGQCKTLLLIGWWYCFIALLFHAMSACSTRLTVSLPLSRKVSHPWMRLNMLLVSAPYSFFLLRTLLQSGFCMFPQPCDLHTENAGSL